MTSLVAYRQPPNLRRILTTNAQPSIVTPHGTTPCNSNRCQLCSFINTSSFITGPNNLTYDITGKFFCNTENVIYAITCTICPAAVYIGETGNTIRERMNGHKSDIKNKKLNRTQFISICHTTQSIA